MQVISAAEAIRQGTEQLFASSEKYYVIGEGTTDPKACFGTTAGLQKKFPNQIFDMPVSENGMTGVAIGSALLGMHPIMVHMRVDFMMYAMDQIINNAAKWNAMFGGARPVPIIIRAFIGRGFGQGMQHSQNLEAMFAHVPGLKVVTPSNAYNAKGLLIAAACENNPVIMIEHRWTHYVTSEVPSEMYKVEIGKARIAREGTDITIVSWSFMLLECLKAADFLTAQGISAEVLDMQTLSPMDIDAVKDSVSKTGRLLVCNEAFRFAGLAGEIIAAISEDSTVPMRARPRRLTNPDYSPPSTHALTKTYYTSPIEIVSVAAAMVGRGANLDAVTEYQNKRVHDVPNADFRGPF